MMMDIVVFFVKQKTAYEMRISDWSSDVCSSDLHRWPSSGAGGAGADIRGTASRRPALADTARSAAAADRRYGDGAFPPGQIWADRHGPGGYADLPSGHVGAMADRSPEHRNA